MLFFFDLLVNKKISYECTLAVLPGQYDRLAAVLKSRIQ